MFNFDSDRNQILHHSILDTDQDGIPCFSTKIGFKLKHPFRCYKWDWGQYWKIPFLLNYGNNIRWVVIILLAITPYKPLTYMMYIVTTTLLLHQVKVDLVKIINTKTIFKLKCTSFILPRLVKIADKYRILHLPMTVTSNNCIPKCFPLHSRNIWVLGWYKFPTGIGDVVGK